MSQKVAASASEGDWGDPIKIKGEQGEAGRGIASVTNYYLASNK
jgi:secreted trypsin-like serine protease